MAYRVHLYPATAERDYTRQLQAYVRSIHAELNKRMAQTDILRTDAWSDTVTALFEALLEWALQPGQTAVIRLPEIFASINQWNDKQWRLQVKAGTGIDLPPSGQVPSGMVPFGSVSTPQDIRARFGIGIDLWRSEPWLVPLRDNWIAENTRLINTIPQQYLGDVEGIIRRGVAQGLAPKELAKQIESRFDVTMNRAKIIARDQTSKANSALTEYRQKDLGVESYTWMSSDDARVRATHRKADGNEYRWDSPPAFTDGHPGQAVMCRCWARAVWPDAEE